MANETSDKSYTTTHVNKTTGSTIKLETNIKHVTEKESITTKYSDSYNDVTMEDKTSMKTGVRASKEYTALDNKLTMTDSYGEASLETKLWDRTEYDNAGIEHGENGKVQSVSYGHGGEVTVGSMGISEKVGNDNLGAELAGEVQALTGKGDVSLKLGKIKKEDGTGTETGASAKLGGEAYLVKGKVDGGLNFLGLKIKTVIEPGLGGVEAEAEVKATTNELSAKVGLGLVVGMDVAVSVDYSGAIKNVVKTVHNVQETLGKYRLKVDTAKLRSTARSVEVEIAEMEKAWNDAIAVIENSRNYWEGDASDQHIKYYKLLAADVRGAFARLKEQPDDLMNMLGVYVTAESRNIQSGSALKTEIIT